MKITKEKLIRIIKEELDAAFGEEDGGVDRARLKFKYKLNDQEVEATMAFLDGDDEAFMTSYRKDPEGGYDVTPYDIFFDYYSDEMPYGTQKARDGDPYEWIFDRLSRELNI